jgi:hypothetical protein
MTNPTAPAGASTASPAPVDIDALLDNAKLPERTVELCLRGDLQSAWEHAERQLAAAQRTAGDSLGGDTPEIEALAARMEDLRAQMAAATVEFTFRALTPRRWAQLLTEHPVGDDAPDRDRMLGINCDTLFPALLIESCAAPAMGQARWDKLLDRITDAQYARLTNTVWMLNRGEIEVPFSRDASRIHAASASASKPPPDSGLA